MRNWQDIGNGVEIAPTVYQSGPIAGYFIRHYHGTEECIAYVPVTGQQKWDVLNWEPLTLNPSINVMMGQNGTSCLHGWIKEGRWVNA